MPRYDFQCRKCSHTFEEERPFGNSATPPCPQCGGRTIKLIAPPAIHFKGEGFYNTDKVKKEGKKGEKKPEAKSQPVHKSPALRDEGGKPEAIDQKSSTPETPAKTEGTKEKSST